MKKLMLALVITCMVSGALSANLQKIKGLLQDLKETQRLDKKNLIRKQLDEAKTNFLVDQAGKGNIRLGKGIPLRFFSLETIDKAIESAKNNEKSSTQNFLNAYKNYEAKTRKDEPKELLERELEIRINKEIEKELEKTPKKLERAPSKEPELPSIKIKEMQKSQIFKVEGPQQKKSFTPQGEIPLEKEQIIIKNLLDKFADIKETDDKETQKEAYQKFEPISLFIQYCGEGDTQGIEELFKDDETKKFIEENKNAIAAGFIVGLRGGHFNVLKLLVQHYREDEKCLPTPCIQEAMIKFTDVGNTNALDFLLEKCFNRKIFLPASQKLFKVIEHMKAHWPKYALIFAGATIFIGGTVYMSCYGLATILDPILLNFIDGQWGGIKVGFNTGDATKFVIDSMKDLKYNLQFTGTFIASLGFIWAAYDVKRKNEEYHNMWDKIEMESKGKIKKEDFHWPIKFWAANTLIQIAAQNKDSEKATRMLNYLLKDKQSQSFETNVRDVEGSYVISTLKKAVSHANLPAIKLLME
ncbi:MAG: hypothetical protein V1855_05225, partial [bacterium]